MGIFATIVILIIFLSAVTVFLFLFPNSFNKSSSNNTNITNSSTNQTTKFIGFAICYPINSGAHDWVSECKSQLTTKGTNCVYNGLSDSYFPDSQTVCMDCYGICSS